MSKLLADLLRAGLIENINGDDERFTKMCSAIDDIADDLTENPHKIIDAILAAINPDISEQDSAIVAALNVMTKHWPTISSVYPNTPIKLLRALLFVACDKAAQKSDVNNAAILWLTAVDMFPLFKLGNEQKAMRPMLTNFGEKVEKYVLEISSIKETKSQLSSKVYSISEFTKNTQFSLDQDVLLEEISSATGPQYQGKKHSNSNPYYPNNPAPWSDEFANRMTELLTKQFNALSKDNLTNINRLKMELKGKLTEFSTMVQSSVQSQRNWVSRRLNKNEKLIQNEQNRLNTLWWYEALYSSSLYCSYRELNPELASIVMAFDLLEQLSFPTLTSTAYVLSEAVCRLPSVEIDKKYKLYELLNILKEEKNNLPSSFLDKLKTFEVKNEKSLRDLVIVALIKNDVNIDEIMSNANLNADIEISLPNFSKAIFRQEQAVRIALEV